jgi:hypothetical protein
MGIQRHQKLNHLQRVLPEGLPVDSEWLQRHGYSRQLIAKYVRNHWLDSPTRGVYSRNGFLTDQHSWEPVVMSLQKLLERPITVGGRTALELHGLAHYLSMTGTSEIHLYGSESLPGWVYKLPLKQKIALHSTTLFSAEHNKQIKQASFTDHRWEASKWSLVISTPERAILELLDELPTRETFHQADVLMEGLSNLRPKYLNLLLAECRSVKTKRLFLWFAERHQHAWLKAIDTERVDIGSGKRMLVPGGKLDPKYLITVPEELASGR